MKVIQDFVFLYPFFMGVFWIVASLTFFYRLERRSPPRPELPEYPRISVLIPCHNEEMAVQDTIEQVLRTNYPNYEIIAVDDCSSDRTTEILRELQTKHDRLRVIRLEQNRGKATALNVAVMATTAEFLLCIDADCLLHEDAMHWMVEPMLNHPRVGAVTGNPRVLNRLTLISRIQVGEFSAIVGMIKRAQRLIGRVYTVSGVVVCFRRRALHHVGYWNPSTVTEDVDISWRLQLAYWGIQFEPRALCWILVPETLRGLWRQRLRWSRGGIEAALSYASAMFDWRKRRMWPVFVEQLVSVTWCYAMALIVTLWALGKILPADALPPVIRVPTLLPGWTGTLLALTCIAQFLTGLWIDSKYEGRALIRVIFWAIWYPVAYWIIQVFTTIVGVPKALANLGRTEHAVWKSPDR